METTTDYIKDITGIPNLTAEIICTLLKRMMIKAQPIENQKIKSFIPITRSDILHPCDLAEDVAVAYGFNK
jgi:phenylalanyl-tRNA synthetase beta chain